MDKWLVAKAMADVANDHYLPETSSFDSAALNAIDGCLHAIESLTGDMIRTEYLKLVKFGKEKSKKFKKYVIVGRIELPVETTVTCKTKDEMLEAVAAFLPGGSLWRAGDDITLQVFAPGDEVPAYIARLLKPSARIKS